MNQSNEPKTRVPAAQFVRVWQASGSAAEVSEELGITPQSAQSRAAAYRKRGVNLKKMPRTGRAKLDVDALNALVDGDE